MSAPRHIWMCPVCSDALIVNGRQFVCPAGHSFDVAREGYVNLILAHQRSSAEPGDPPDSVRNRRAFLEAGHYEPLAQAVAKMASSQRPGHLLDAGCGEGWLLRRLREGLSSLEPVLHGVDISRTAASLAARAGKGEAYAVGNTFRLPVLPGSVDLVLVMMAPRDEVEIRRVLKSTGHFLCVAPGPDHLAAFRSMVYPEAQRHADKEIPAGFRLMAQEQIRFGLTLTTPASVAQLIEMTPYKWHMDPATYERVREQSSLVDTADFVLQLMAPI